ncbi:thioredoxin-like protein [Dentipellis sp. KUC8613]|nr:thioredoxin-like protein [Dentipellis sp. KUC8613]
MGSRKVKLIIISDFTCPWCYVGFREMQKAIAQCSTLPITFEVEFRPFLLHPDLPDEGVDKLDWFYKKIGKAKFDSIMEMAIQQGENVGINFSFQGKIAQTTRAHRLMSKALEIGGSPLQLKLVRLLFKAYMEEEQDIADMGMLSEMAECAGVMSKDEVSAPSH